MRSPAMLRRASKYRFGYLWENCVSALSIRVLLSVQKLPSGFQFSKQSAACSWNRVQMIRPRSCFTGKSRSRLCWNGNAPARWYISPNTRRFSNLRQAERKKFDPHRCVPKITATSLIRSFPVRSAIRTDGSNTGPTIHSPRIGFLTATSSEIEPLNGRRHCTRAAGRPQYPSDYTQALAAYRSS